MVARKCGSLEWEVEQEQERVGIVTQDQTSRAADSHLRRWGQEDLRGNLTKRNCDVSRLPSRSIAEQYMTTRGEKN